MILLDAQGLRKFYGPEPVLDGAALQVRPGERIGLVGPNGCGKTTLLRILAGLEEADAGACQRHPSVHLGMLQQRPQFDAGRTVSAEAHAALAGLLSLQEEAVAVADALAETADAAERIRLGARYDHLQHELQRRDAYQLDHKIERVLDGLGFTRAAHQQSAESLSGGEQNRLLLAKLLLAEPNLMLLDEPSNHLDIAATEWLETFLIECSAAIVVVSHDRSFLDKVTNRTAELFQGTIETYTGNYSAYRQQKAERLLVQRRTYEKQQIEIAKAEEFIRRNFYGQKAAQAEDRRKKLQRIERVPPPREIQGPPMGFPKVARSGDIVLRAEGLAKGFDRPLFSDVSVQITRGERWALLGPNGSGKTTLLRCLLGLAPADRGRVQLGQGVLLGYFDQQLAELDDATPAEEAVRPPHKQFEQPQRRDLLARFGIRGDTALQPVGLLSGGERCRTALARLSAADANFLVLDEPTNHLDLWARDALERALKAFDGSVLFVSHDRYFVNQVADHLLVIEPQRVRAVEGNYDDYLRLTGRAGDPARPRDGQPAVRAAEQAKPPKGKRKFAFRRVAEIEAEIFQREQRIAHIQQMLSLGETHREQQRVQYLLAEIAVEEEALRELYEHWEEAAEAEPS